MTKLSKFFVPIAMFTALAACGSSETSSDDPQPSAPVEVSSEAGDTVAPETPAAEAAVTLTVADGTVLNLVVDTCDINGDEVFLLASNVDDDDEVFFQISQSSAESMTGILQTGYIDGDAEANYTFGYESVVLDAEGNPLSDPLVVDGQMVSGTLTMQFSSSQGDNPIFGDAVTGEVQADCG